MKFLIEEKGHRLYLSEGGTVLEVQLESYGTKVTHDATLGGDAYRKMSEMLTQRVRDMAVEAGFELAIGYLTSIQSSKEHLMVDEDGEIIPDSWVVETFADVAVWPPAPQEPREVIDP